MKKVTTILFLLCLGINSFGAAQNPDSLNEKFRSAMVPLRPAPPCHLQRIEGEGYVDYGLGINPKGAWEISICDLTEVATHFHKTMESHFIVLEGIALVTLDGKSQILTPGQHIHIGKKVVHAIKSADPATSVRFLCSMFPAYDPTDYHLLSATL